MKALIAAAAVSGALLALAPVAQADPITNAGDDSYVATCTVLGQELNGNLGNDAIVTVGIAYAIADHYGLTPADAVKVENYQVQSYCPSYWPNLVAVGNAARSDGMKARPVDYVCEEDQPCWDCRTMGNDICGPDNETGVPEGDYSEEYA